MRGLLLIAAIATACENFAATAQEVLAEFREISGKCGGELAHGRRPANRVWLVSFRPANRAALARRQRGQARAAGCRRAASVGRAGPRTRHQAGPARARLGRHGGRRRRAHLLYSGAARCARRRRPAPALHRDPAPARLPPHGAGHGRRTKRCCRAIAGRVTRTVAVGRAGRRVRRACARLRSGAVRPASDRFHQRRAGYRQELACRRVFGAATDEPDGQDRARPMSRPSRRWRALSALDRGIDAPGRRCGRRGGERRFFRLRHRAGSRKCRRCGLGRSAAHWRRAAAPRASA